MGFQFLIGTLKTRLTYSILMNIVVVSIPHRHAKNIFGRIFFLTFLLFQFLIGTLKTPVQSGKVINKKVFQFLIGTLKTKLKGGSKYGNDVSIPHRHAKNFYLGRLYDPPQYSFNSS